MSHCPVPLTPAKLPFLRSVRLANVAIDDFGKDIFRYLIGGALDIESLYVSFKVGSYKLTGCQIKFLPLTIPDLRLLLLRLPP